MNTCTRPARCLLTTLGSSNAGFPKPTSTRTFHTTPARSARRRRPHYPSIKADELKLLNQQAAETFPKYNDAESSLLGKQYTAGQLAAIKAAETVIDSRDLLTQSRQRTDPWRLPYWSDLSQKDPVLDHAEKLPASAIPGEKTLRAANPVERDAAIVKIANENLAKMYPDGVPEGTLDPTQQNELEQAMEAAVFQAALDPRATYVTDNEEAAAAMADPRFSIQLPDLPRLENRMARQTRRLSTEEQEDPRQKRLLQYLDWNKKQLKSVRTKTLVVHGVTNQTRMGKIRSMYYLTIAGNGNGLLGVGEGKSVEPEEGRKQSIMAAIRNLKPVPRYENRTIYGTLEKKVGATKVQLYSRPPGFGLRVQHLIFEMARAAGLQDLSAKTPRSRNKMNVIKATWEALTSQKLPDEIARGRGKKLVDVRKVYYGGSVH
ncbi:37S ribosomal protein-like protein S5 [Sporormia fimetaria CBS 119925]|uniref:Small ribosomal subunit protein uS5m n=1 Tax=Sporormia fimetaria CBS 119925 TaxID=1340428 RepID=A0A6A6V762_9PLEO|nr:37S ribosomal protein-like protein S5 [Sporormia fimetaria CBS 119925]